MDGGNDRGLLRKYNVLCCVGVTSVGQKTPVDVSSITDIRVVIFGCRGLKYSLHQTLGFLRPLKEELDNGGEDLQLCLEIKS